MAKARGTNGTKPPPEQVVEITNPLGGVPSVIRWNPYEELGRTGLNAIGGYVQEEFRPELQGQRGMRTYREMASNSAVLGAILFAVEYLVRQVSWNVEASDPNDPQSVEIAAFGSEVLKDMSFSLLDMISEVFSMIVFGFCPMETVYKHRGGESEDPTARSRFDDGRVGWRKLAPRSQETVTQWQIDDAGGIQAMVQQPPPDYRQRVIPLDKMLLFRTRLRRNNPEGVSLLRTCWRSWYIGKRLEELEAIVAQRDGTGTPLMIAPEGLDLWDPANATAVAKRREAEKIVRSAMVDEQMGYLLPHGWELKLLASPGTRQLDVDRVIQRWDNRIAMTFLADFMLLGQQGGRGSFALSESKSRLFSVALGALTDTVADVVNRHGFPRLVALNGWPRALSPTLTHTDVQDEDLAGIAAYVRELASAGAPMFPDEELENALREKAKLPLRAGGGTQVKKGFRTRATVAAGQRRALGAIERALLLQTDDAGFRKGFRVGRESARSFGYRRPVLVQ